MDVVAEDVVALLSLDQDRLKNLDFFKDEVFPDWTSKLSCFLDSRSLWALAAAVPPLDLLLILPL